MSDDNFDALLNAPLASVEDRGFSANVTKRIRAAQNRRRLFELGGLLAASAVVLAIMPLGSFTGTIESVSQNLGNSTAFAAGVAGLILSMSFAGLMFDRED